MNAWERPITYNTAPLFNEQHSSYDAEAEKMRLAILNADSVVGPSLTGSTYYISPKGDDQNDGLSPQTAWRTLQNLQDATAFSAGDVFFCLPSLPYSMEANTDLEYAYITFLGARSNMLLEKVGVNRQSFAFHGVHDALAIWRAALESTEQGAVADLVCESVLLYTFALLGRGRDDDDEALDDTVLRVKKYVDENYSDSEMDLDTLAERFSYSKKYLSAAFKNRFGVGFSEHLRSLRITHACALVEQGFTSVKDIACMCGFADQMYFSKVFKESMGVSPKEYIAKGKER
jgi:AraC-like DNA-binding protein